MQPFLFAETRRRIAAVTGEPATPADLYGHGVDPQRRVTAGHDLAHGTDGSLLLIIPASHETDITLVILKHGSHVEVLEPEWLREKVGEELSAAAGRYCKGEE